MTAASGDGSGSLILAVTPSGEGVRRALADTRKQLHAWGRCRDGAGSAEIVLAEILNNIVEHALADRTDGRIELRLSRRDGAVAVTIADNGAPMPGLSPPPRRPAELDVTLDELPEGGFGWHLIHLLAQDLRYRREDGWNRISLTLPT